MSRTVGNECEERSNGSNGVALDSRLFRHKDLARLAEHADVAKQQPELLTSHPSIRSMDQYRLEDFV